MNIRYLTLGLVVAALVSSIPIQGTAGRVPLCKGIGFHTAMNWPLTRPGPGTEYIWPPFSDPTHRITKGELAKLHDAGFDFVRLTVDPAIFLQTPEPRLSQLYGILRTNVAKITSAGLNVIVDLHPVTQNPAYPPKELVVSDSAPLFVRYRDMIGRFASALSLMNTRMVALELMNEPPTGWDQASSAQWQSMAEELFHTARTVAPDLTLIVSGARGGDIDGLLELDPRPFMEGPVYFSFHYYSPYIFTTFPGNKNHEDGRYLTEVPFPPGSQSIQAAYIKSARLISVDKSLSTLKKIELKAEVHAELLSYLRSGIGETAIDTDFEKVNQWAVRNGVPATNILLGEFGVVRTYGIYHGAREYDRILWLRAVRMAAERARFAWAIWAYKGFGGMAIVRSDNSDSVDKNSLRALGLGTNYRAKPCAQGTAD